MIPVQRCVVCGCGWCVVCAMVCRIPVLGVCTLTLPINKTELQASLISGCLISASYNVSYIVIGWQVSYRQGLARQAALLEAQLL